MKSNSNSAISSLGDGSFIRFENAEFWYLLLIIPLLVFIFLIAQQIKKKKLQNFGHLPVIMQLMPSASKSRPVLKFVLQMIAVLLVIIAILRPQTGAKLGEVKRKGIELMIALDVSNSMLSKDIRPNRLKAAQRSIAKLISELENDKIGLIVFAGDAFMLVPTTTDYSAAKMMLSTISTDFIPRQGTAIGTAIKLAAKSFGPTGEQERALVIITDGENHEDDAILEAEAALEKGIIIHTIGMGTPEGSLIPLPKEDDKYRTDKSGSFIITKLNETLLQKIAIATGGSYVRANNSQTGLEMVFDKISKMEKQEIEVANYSEYDDIFQYFIGFALFFILADMLISEKKNPKIQNLNLLKRNWF